VSLAGAVTGVYGVSVFLGAALFGRLSEHWHPSRLIAMGGVAAVLGCGGLAVSQRPAMAVAVAALLGLAWTSMHSSLQTWATEILPGARASLVSLFAGSLFVGSAIAAVLVSGWANAGRYSLIYTVTGACAVPLAIGAGWARRRWHRPPAELSS
jgi:predicted MFS family arabinose efflux permease